jgi:hypothetical protein
MNWLVRRVVFTVIGVVIALGIMTVRGRFGGSGGGGKTVEGIPPKVFDGTLACTIKVELSDPGDIDVHFATGNGYDVNKPQYVNARQSLPAGKHEWKVLVPARTSCNPEVHIRPPALKKGSKIVLTVNDGKTDHRDEAESDTATLPSGTAFFAQLEVENCGGK